MASDEKPRPSVVLLGVDSPSTRSIYHALAKEFGDIPVLLEDSLSRTRLLRNRIRSLGLLHVIGQILFLLLVQPMLRKRGSRRIASIVKSEGLNHDPIPRAERVGSVNSDEARAVLQEFSPGVVVVSGTRIISRETLRCVPARFINMHSGITPMYRGVHGGYWALAEKNSSAVGTTVHYVDEGIDTGEIIAQATFPVSAEDSFATYPYLHTAAGLPLLLAAVRSALGSPSAQRTVHGGPSRFRSHPTLLTYLRHRITHGVK